ncbi:hypothetical protein APS58_4347 [Paracidovorax citrulli]|nr:hypothetical protein APS58_4347 [Paracidovorax citrulli]
MPIHFFKHTSKELLRALGANHANGLQIPKDVIDGTTPLLAETQCIVVIRLPLNAFKGQSDQIRGRRRAKDQPLPTRNKLASNRRGHAIQHDMHELQMAPLGRRLSQA